MAAPPVSLVGDLFVIDALEVAGALEDRPLDVVVRHVLRFRRVDGETQTRVAFGISASGTCRNGDFTNELRELRPPLGIEDRLLPLDLGPLVMTGHLLWCQGIGGI